MPANTWDTNAADGLRGLQAFGEDERLKKKKHATKISAEGAGSGTDSLMPSATKNNTSTTTYDVGPKFHRTKQKPRQP